MAVETMNPISGIGNWFKNLGNKRIRIVRLFSQVIFFFILNGVFFGLARVPAPLPVQLPPGAPYAVAWGSFQALQYILAQGQFPFFVLGTFFLTGAIFGRLFCGWACPVGFWQDLMSWLPVPKYKMARNDNRGLVMFAWLIIVLSIISVTISGFERATGQKLVADARNQIFSDGTIDPAGVLMATLYYATTWGTLEFNENFISSLDKIEWPVRIKLIIFIVVAFVSMKVPRAYCRWICPTGALLGACSKYSVMTVKKNEELCEDGCHKCANACPMGINIADFKAEGIDDSLCINCGDCIDACPDALSFGVRG